MTKSRKEEEALKAIEAKLERFAQGDPPEVSEKHPNRTPDCLPLDRVFVAIGLEPAEKQHLDQCEAFCQRRVKSFKKLPLQYRRLVPAGDSPAAAPGANPPIRFPKLFVPAVAAALLLCLFLATAGFVTFRSAFEQAARLRARLGALREASGLSGAVRVDFDASQPNIAMLAVSCNPSLVRAIQATSDDGATWSQIYPATVPGGGLLIPSGDIRHEFVLPRPSSGEINYTVLVRAEYAAEVVKAFPEYSMSDHTDIKGLFRVSSEGITRLIASEEDAAVEPEIQACQISEESAGWELDGSPRASASLSNDPADGALVQDFELPGVGEYTLLRHSVPGAVPGDPSSSLRKVTAVEFELFWDGSGPVTLEPRLCDHRNKILGITRFIEPTSRWQTIRIPVSSLTEYFGATQFDINHVQRLDLAIARKASDECASGSAKLRRIRFRGTAELHPFELPADLVTICDLSLAASAWEQTASSTGRIAVSSDEDALVCAVTLPFDESGGLPWGNLRAQLPEEAYARLAAVDIRLMWQGSGPITLEPKLTVGPEKHTYGRYVRVKPAAGVQTVRVWLHELRYFWSDPPGSMRVATLDRSAANAFSIGVSLKAHTQTVRGSLRIEAVRFLGSS